MRSFILLILSSWFFIPSIAHAARECGIVEKKFDIEGEDAIAIMDFLGFASSTDGEYQLNSSDGDNRIIFNFLGGTKPKLLIYGKWTDGETGSLPDVPRYTFNSPAINSNNAADWNRIAAKHQNELSNNKEKIELFANKLPLISIVSRIWKNNIYYTLGIDERSPTDRSKAEKRYQECEKEMIEKELNGGC
jgi:hypothetical protein